MQLFSAFRENGWNTYYKGRQTPAYFDVSLAILCFAASVTLAVLVIIVIGTRSQKRWTTFIRLVLNLHPGFVIIVCLTGRNWMDSHIHTHSQYATRNSPEISGEIAIQIGLKAVNVTLTGAMNVSQGAVNTVAFNEIFSFNKVTGLEDSLKNSLGLGKPAPILYVLDYLAMDYGDLRWTREWRLAGHFVYIMLWSSLASWLVALLVLAFVVSRGALFLFLSGLLMVCSTGLYHGLHPGHALTIPFEDSYMTFHYGWCFWLSAIFGSITCIWASIIFCYSIIFPDKAAGDFLVDANQLDAHTPSPTRQSPLLIHTPHQDRKRTFNYLGSFYENQAFLDDGSPVRKCSKSVANFPDAMEFREVPSKAKLMDSPCQQEGEEQESSFASLVLEGSLTEPTSRAESIVDPEGSFIDDSISDHINLSGENYGENDECSNRPATRRSDFDCDSFETFDSEGDEIKDEAVGTGRRKTIIDIEQGNIQYETNVTAC